MEAFTAKAKELETSELPIDRRHGILTHFDPAEKLLEVKICDPAMGSRHFLVRLVDYLADRVISAMAEAEGEVPFGDYGDAQKLSLRILFSRSDGVIPFGMEGIAGYVEDLRFLAGDLDPFWI